MGNIGSSRTLVLVIVGLVSSFIITIILFFTLFFFRDPRVEANTLEFEAAKTFLQIAGVILFGALVALSTFLFQQEWTTRRENFSRETENLRDKRERQDAALRNMLNETLKTYNGVKRVRRVLKAETGAADRKSISKEVYKGHLLELNNYQLTFEHLKKTVPMLNDERLSAGLKDGKMPQMPIDLEYAYREVESYLNRIFKEFEENLHIFDDRDSVSLSSLEFLNKFVSGSTSGNFTAGVSAYIDQILATLQRALLVPLTLPKVGSH